MDTFKHISILPVVFVVAVVAGCNQEKQAVLADTEDVELVRGEAAENTPLPTVSVDDTLAEISVKKGSAYQKPGASVRFSHNYDGRSEAGEIESLTLSFHHAYDSGRLSIQLDAQEGLSIVDNQSPYRFTMDKPQTVEIEAQLSADSEGKYYLSIVASVENQNANPISRVFALALNVGELGAEKSGLEPVHMSIEKSATDETLILMPAEETISQ